jgi:hypothetical protein
MQHERVQHDHVAGHGSRLDNQQRNIVHFLDECATLCSAGFSVL